MKRGVEPLVVVFVGAFLDGSERPALRVGILPGIHVPFEEQSSKGDMLSGLVKGPGLFDAALDEIFELIFSDVVEHRIKDFLDWLRNLNRFGDLVRGGFRHRRMVCDTRGLI